MRTVRALLSCLPVILGGACFGRPHDGGLLAISFLAVGQKSLDQRVQDATDLFRQGKLADAIAQFESIHRQYPDSYESLSWLGYLYLRNHDPARAVPLLEAARAREPHDVEVLTNLGNAYMATGEYDKAIAKYQVVCKLEPKMFEPLYNLGTIYLREKQYAKAITELMAALRLKPDDPFTQNSLGVAFEATGNLPRAAESFRHAASLRPGNVTFARNAGLVLWRMRLAVDAVPYLEVAKGDGSDPVVALALGAAYTQSGRRDLALKYYEGIRGPEANNPTFWFNLAVLRGEFNDVAGADQAYRRVLELNPNDLDSLNNLGLLLYKQGKFGEATPLFDKLAGLDPNSVDARVNLASSAANSGDLPKAIGAWKEVIRIRPDDTQIRLALANALWETGDVDGARFHFMQLLGRDKNNVEALNGIGLCHLRASKLPQAEAAFRSAIEVAPTFVAAYNNLAITLERMHQVSEAINVLVKAQKIAPDNQEISKNLSRLRTGG